MNRYQAFGIHFLISLMIFVVLVALVFTYWFPGILADADSSWEQMLLVIAGVDLVLGPMLTLIVFNPQKKSLKFDLATIACVQIAVLAYGVFTMHNTRPLALYSSFPKMGFEILYAHETNNTLKEFLSGRDDKLFFYNQESKAGSVGPGKHKDLFPKHLKAINSAHVSDFQQWTQAQDIQFDSNGLHTFPILTGNRITLDRNGAIQPAP